MKYYAIIVGGGSGKRMQNSIPKQFLLLKNKPVLMHTISAFFSCKFNPEILIVLHADLHQYWKELCVQYNLEIPHLLVSGGEQRFHSVRNGLMAIKHDGFVAVHDAVRPLASIDLIDKCFEAATDIGNAVTCIKPSDSVRKINSKTNSEIVDRDQLVLIQTPQTFKISQLREAYKQPYQNKFTDDASVVEEVGFPINLIEGERNNFKITYVEDLELANLIIK